MVLKVFIVKVYKTIKTFKTFKITIDKVCKEWYFVLRGFEIEQRVQEMWNRDRKQICLLSVLLY